MNEKPKEPEEIEDITPYKNAEFEAFVLWSSIPLIVRSIYQADSSEGKLKAGKKLGELGFDIEEVLLRKLLDCKTQKEFAKAFEVHFTTLSEWKQKKYYKKKVEAMTDDVCVLQYKKDVKFSFIQKTIEEGDAPRVKLFHQLYDDFADKKVTEITGSGGTDLFEHSDISNEELNRRIKVLVKRFEGGLDEAEQKEQDE